eukprot:448784-Pleurochrysis_carterae.AAC.1
MRSGRHLRFSFRPQRVRRRSERRDAFAARRRQVRVRAPCRHQRALPRARLLEEGRAQRQRDVGALARA